MKCKCHSWLAYTDYISRSDLQFFNYCPYCGKKLN